MRWPESVSPVRMRRVALVAPRDALREALVRVADAGVVELDEGPAQAEPGPAGRLLATQSGVPGAPRVAPRAPDLAGLVRTGRADLLAGEAEVEAHASAAMAHGEVAALVGWTPEDQVGPLQRRLAEVGASAVPLRTPPGVEPPTLLHEEGAGRSFAPLVRTYGTVGYSDLDPTLVAGIAYVAMFGMMFADAGHGAVLVAAAMMLRAGRPRRLAPRRRLWPFLAGAGAASMLFGVLYGEFFGPTGILPVRWLAPLERPMQLLLAAMGVGAILLAGAYALGIANRWREGGPRAALYASSGIAGAGLFLGLGLIAAGWYLDLTWPLLGGLAVVVAGLGLTFAGRLAEAGGGATGVIQASVELFDAVLRLGTNLVSFARLAAFGLTHAALGAVVWQATTGLWSAGAAGAVAAVVVFLVGNAVTFGLEALVAGVQALRLEYYELFSRVFGREGRPFRPWHVPVDVEVTSS